MIRDIPRYMYHLSHFENDPGDFTERVAIQNETWVHHFDTESKKQSKQCKQPGLPRLKEFKRVHSAGKVMASIVWNSQGVIMIDYLEPGRTINNTYYSGELRWLRQKIARKRRGKLAQCALALAGQRPCSHVTSCHDCCD